MSREISAALRRLVRERAKRCCEYCCMPDTETLYPHEADHIIAVKHGGPTIGENLAYACFECNRAKGSDVASVDPASSDITPLFHPRRQVWTEHFRFNGPIIEPLTANGRATVYLLHLNTPARISVRDNLMQAGAFRVPV